MVIRIRLRGRLTKKLIFTRHKDKIWLSDAGEPPVSLIDALRSVCTREDRARSVFPPHLCCLATRLPVTSTLNCRSQFSRGCVGMAPLSIVAANLAPWPVAPIVKYALAPALPPEVEPAATRFQVSGPVMTNPIEHLMLIVTCGWKFLFALAVYYVFPIDLAAARVLDPWWIARVVLRDLVITYAVGAWDLVNLSPLSPVYEKMKVGTLFPLESTSGESTSIC